MPSTTPDGFGYCIFTFEGGDWSTDDFAGLDRGFALAAELGYSYVEIPSYVQPAGPGVTPRTDLQLLDRLGTVTDLSAAHGVPLSAIFAAADLHDPDQRATEYHSLAVLARYASTLGIRHLPVTVGMGRGSDETRWSSELGKLLTEAAKRTADVGVRLAVHPHIECPVETRAEIDAFFDAADTDYVGMCLDAGHVLAAGADPVSLARDYASVITYVHAKDVDAEAARRAATSTDRSTRYGVFRDPGEGDVDFPALFSALYAAGFDGPVLAENDISPDPEGGMRKAAAYLTRTLAAARSASD